MNETNEAAPASASTNIGANDAMNKFMMPGSVLIAGLMIAGAVVWSNGHPSAGGTGGVAGAGGAQAVAADISKINVEGEPFIGNPDAKVVIAFWSDYQCPFCKAFEVGHPQIPNPPALPDIVKNYVDTGKVKVVFKDFAFLGQDSLVAGEYGRAMWKLYPGQYMAWRTAMYTAQDDEGDQGFGDEESVKTLTKTIVGVDVAKVAADVAANKAAYDKAMNDDRTEAQTVGITGTPGFVIGKKALTGAQPYATFEAAIKLVLK